MRLISNTSKIGAALHARREEQGKTVAWVAETAGVPRSTVTRVESGKMNPTWSLVLAFSQVLDLQPMLIPRERMSAVEAVVKMSDTPETPPLAGEEW